MKSFVYVLLLAAIISAAPSANAQPAGIRFTVPFQFLAGDTVLPAGVYQIEIEPAYNRLGIRQVDGTAGAFITAHTGTRKGGLHQNVAVFNKYGDSYVLRHVAVAGHYEGRDLYRSKAEREIAKRQTSRVELAWLRQ